MGEPANLTFKHEHIYHKQYQGYPRECGKLLCSGRIRDAAELRFFQRVKLMLQILEGRR